MSKVLILIIVVAIIGLGILGYFLFFNEKAVQETVSNYCGENKSGKVIKVAKCGDFYKLTKGCCDFPDTWLDHNGETIMDCGGFGSYAGECKEKFVDSGIRSSCQTIKECNPSEFI